MSQKWCIAHKIPLQDENGNKVYEIPLGAVSEYTGRQRTVNGVLWSEIAREGKSGWINDAYLEDYSEMYPNFEVEITEATPATPTLDDAAQYLLLEGNVKYNLCGEFCVAFIVRKTIGALLMDWKANFPEIYRNKLSGQNDQKTGPGDLETMLSPYGYSVQKKNIMSLNAGLTDPVISFLPAASPGRFKRLLETHYLIAGVKIDTTTGKLRGQGAGHWVVLDKISPVGTAISGNGGWVEIYNPFPNRREEYSYAEFTTSMGLPGTWLGLWVKRNIGD